MNSTNRGGRVSAWVREQDPRLLAAADRVRVRGDELAEEGVEPAGRDPVLPGLERRVQGRHQLVHVPAGARRDVDPRRPRHLHEVALDLALEVEAALLVEQVPLVVGDDQRAAGLDDHRDDAGVLLGQRLARVDQDDGHLGPVQRRLGAQGRVVVGAAGLVRPAPDARGVDEPPVSAAELDQLVDRVAGGAGDRVDDDPLGAGELVEQAGLADVGLAQQRDPARAALERRRVSAGVSGSAASTASSRSPLPRPCRAETA